MMTNSVKHEQFDLADAYRWGLVRVISSDPMLGWEKGDIILTGVRIGEDFYDLNLTKEEAASQDDAVQHLQVETIPSVTISEQ